MMKENNSFNDTLEEIDKIMKEFLHEVFKLILDTEENKGI